jgi:hypothetical protein
VRPRRGDPGVDLDRDPAVHAVGAVVDLAQLVAGPADVEGRQHPDRLADVRAPQRQVADLLVVGGAVGQRLLEDRRVGRDAHDLLVADELGEVARAQPLTGQVVEPHRDTSGGEVGQGSHAISSRARGGLSYVVVGGQLPLLVRPSFDIDARAAATTRSVVSPNCSYSTV